MAEEIDVLIRQKTGWKNDSAIVSRDDELGEKSGAFRLDELPGLIAKPVGVDEKEIKEIKAIVDRWLR